MILLYSKDNYSFRKDLLLFLGGVPPLSWKKYPLPLTKKIPFLIKLIESDGSVVCSILYPDYWVALLLSSKA